MTIVFLYILLEKILYSYMYICICSYTNKDIYDMCVYVAYI